MKTQEESLYFFWTLKTCNNSITKAYFTFILMA